jgi:hypothetical protein
MNYLPVLALDLNPITLCLLHSQDYSHELLVPGSLVILKIIVLNSLSDTSSTSLSLESII